MRDKDIPAYLEEVKSTLINHFPDGVLIFCFKEDEKDSKVIKSTGMAHATMVAIELTIKHLYELKNKMEDEILKNLKKEKTA